ncbi:hypothetical protein OQA88_10536 [Cercophora sp. LCS_1]
MDPITVLGAIASVVSVSNALGFGIKTLRSLANASEEFRDMLNELSNLQTLVEHLRATADNMADPRLAVPNDFVCQIRTIESELNEIVGSLLEIQVKLQRNRKQALVKGAKEPGVSAISWQRVRGKVRMIRDRGKRCQDSLNICLGLLGIFQQYEYYGGRQVFFKD